MKHQQFSVISCDVEPFPGKTKTKNQTQINLNNVITLLCAGTEFEQISLKCNVNIHFKIHSFILHAFYREE